MVGWVPDLVLSKPLVEGAAAEVLHEVRGGQAVEASDEVGIVGEAV